MASPAEEAQVREATRRAIQGVDLETVKEKQIVEMVEAQLGILLGDDEALMACISVCSNFDCSSARFSAVMSTKVITTPSVNPASSR